MDELLEIIAKRIADTSAHSACDWDYCVDENKAAFLDYAAIALRAIEAAGYEIVAPLPAWAILPNETLIERMGGRFVEVDEVERLRNADPLP